jgi:energy-coupling factor transport system substrate-specific component
MTKNEFAITTRDIVLIGVALAIIESVKFALSFIPGVEIVSLLFVIYTLFFQKKMVYVLPTFCLLEGAMYGFGIWWFMYLYIWAILVSVVYLFRNKTSVWFWSTLSGIYGLLFGLLCCPVYFATVGIDMAMSWWIAGIHTDIVHGIFNFIICLILFKPLSRVLKMT